MIGGGGSGGGGGGASLRCRRKRIAAKVLGQNGRWCCAVSLAARKGSCLISHSRLFMEEQGREGQTPTRKVQSKKLPMKEKEPSS